MASEKASPAKVPALKGIGMSESLSGGQEASAAVATDVFRPERMHSRRTSSVSDLFRLDLAAVNCRLHMPQPMLL